MFIYNCTKTNDDIFPQYQQNNKARKELNKIKAIEEQVHIKELIYETNNAIHETI